MKYLLVILFTCSFFQVTFAAEDLREEMGKDSSFYKVVSATTNINVQKLVVSELENSFDFTFTGIEFSELQPTCEGKDRFKLLFASTWEKCVQHIYVGECGEVDSQKVRVDGEFTCSDTYETKIYEIK